MKPGRCPSAGLWGAILTRHADESPDDVAFFFVLNTNFNEHDFKRFLVLHVGDGHAKGKWMRRYGGTLSTMGRPDKPLQPTAFGRG